METSRMTREIEVRNTINRLQESIHYTTRSGWSREEKEHLIEIYNRQLISYQNELELINERKRRAAL